MDTTAVTDPTMMGLPVELHDNIAGFANKETNRNMRLVCKKLEPSYTRAFFKEAVFHGEYARVATRLQQFRDFGHSIYVRYVHSLPPQEFSFFGHTKLTCYKLATPR